jgi:hypothetical protein
VCSLFLSHNKIPEQRYKKTNESEVASASITNFNKTETPLNKVVFDRDEFYA